MTVFLGRVQSFPLVDSISPQDSEPSPLPIRGNILKTCVINGPEFPQIAVRGSTKATPNGPGTGPDQSLPSRSTPDTPPLETWS